MDTNQMNEKITTTYTISKHAKERYVTRIMDKDNNNDVQRFIVENEEKIRTDINKMITYGKCIYSGKQSQKDGKGKVLDVYLKDFWIVLVDTQDSIVVTLYKIDLGLGDDFNLEYVSKYMDKLNEFRNELSKTQLDVCQETNMYKTMIDEAEIQIKEYKSFIKNLEDMIDGYKKIIENNSVKVSQANADVANVINTLIGKKEF